MIKLLFTGDFCPQGRVEELSARKEYDKVFNDLTGVFQNNDLNVVDLECPLTLSSEKIKKSGPHLCVQPHTIELLNFLEVRLAALANNHIMDSGVSGLQDTIDLCRKNNIATVGAGNNLSEARIPYSITIRGKRIAIINFAENEFSNTDGDWPGANPLNVVDNYHDIQEAKKNHDYVIVVIHGGNEFYKLPSPRIKKKYRFFIEAGADAIISHHTHIFSGYEIFNGKPIFYGLGNFIFDWPGKRNSDWNKGFIVKLLLDDTIGFEIIPFIQNNERPGVWKLTQSEQKEFTDRLQQLNAVIADDVQLKKEFENFCSAQKEMYHSFLEPYFGRIAASLRKRKLFPRFLSKRKRLLLLNIIRCESHRDVLLTNLLDQP